MTIENIPSLPERISNPLLSDQETEDHNSIQPQEINKEVNEDISSECFDFASGNMHITLTSLKFDVVQLANLANQFLISYNENFNNSKPEVKYTG